MEHAYLQIDRLCVLCHAVQQTPCEIEGFKKDCEWVYLEMDKRLFLKTDGRVPFHGDLNLIHCIQRNIVTLQSEAKSTQTHPSVFGGSSSSSSSSSTNAWK